MFMIHMKLWRSGYKIHKSLRFEFVYVDSLVNRNINISKSFPTKLRFQEKFATIGNLFKVLLLFAFHGFLSSIWWILFHSTFLLSWRGLARLRSHFPQVSYPKSVRFGLILWILSMHRHDLYHQYQISSPFCPSFRKCQPSV